ncbi:MAG: radical SAM protein, partial [Calditrichota bacterium]
IDYEGDQFIASGNVEQDVLDITAVHPMRRSGIDRLLRTAGGSWTAIENLLQQEQLVEVEYEGEQFYVRNLKL